MKLQLNITMQTISAQAGQTKNNQGFNLTLDLQLNFN